MPAATTAPTSMRSAAVAGSFWVVAGFGASQVMRLGGNVVLAWLLAPSAFGLMLLVNTVLHGLAMFSDIGIGASIIQEKRGDSSEFLRTAWTVQIIRGVILWIACCALAWPVAAFFALNDPAYAQLVYLLPVAGLSAIIAGFNSPALFLLKRRFLFGRLARIEIATHGFGIAVMVVWGLLHPTVWALLAGGLVSVAAKMVLSHFALAGADAPCLRAQWHSESARALFRFGKWIFASTLVTFLAINLDKAILGKLLSVEMFGLYAVALALAKVTMDVGQRLSGTVIFPILSRFQDDAAKVVSMCIRSRRAVLWVSGAACAGFAVAGPLFFQMLYDPRYHFAGEIARWLSMYIWVAVLITSMDQIPLALGSSRALFVANLIKTGGIGLGFAGYHAAALPGFIVGLTCGWLAALGYLIVQVPLGRKALLTQSIVFTAGWIAYVLPAVAILNHLAAQDRVLEIAMTLVLTALPALVAAAMLWHVEGRTLWKSSSTTALRPGAAAEPA